MSAAAAINERGQIVGAATDGFRSRVLGRRRDHRPDAAGPGLVRGQRSAVATGRGAVWTNGRTIEFAPPRGYTIAVASPVNDGAVAGNVSVSSTPFVWQAVFWPGAARGRTGGQD